MQTVMDLFLALAMDVASVWQDQVTRNEIAGLSGPGLACGAAGCGWLRGGLEALSPA